MADSNTIRILSLDGGGERGYLSLKFLQKFIDLWGVDPSTLASKFDVICGTSIGGIMSLAFASGKTPDEIESFFTTTGPYIFTLGTTSGIPPVWPVPPTSGIRINTLNEAAILGLIADDTPFYHSSGYYANNYGTGLLATTLQGFFGSTKLKDLQTNVLIPSYQTDVPKFVSFSNWNNPRYIGQNEYVSNAALATSAAPLYLASDSYPIQFGNPSHKYSDGGIYLNNPALMGLALGQIVKPYATRYCILSLGTGLNPGEGSYAGQYSTLYRRLSDHVFRNNLSLVNPLTLLGQLLVEAGTGSEEAVHETLSLMSNLYTLNQLYYYRFQPIFNDIPQGEDTGLDNTSTTILNYYDTKATAWYENDLANIQTFINRLNV